MKGAVKWMTHHHVAANLLMFVFIIGGFLEVGRVKQEVFPEVALDMVQVSVAYPGAGPEEVEEGIILKIEDNLTGVDGIKVLKAFAAEGSGSVIAELMKEADADRVLQDIKSEVDRIVTFPEDAEKPVIRKLLNRREVISVVIYGDATERSLREQAETIRDELLEYDGITQVDLGGVRPYEISVEISEENLRRYDLTLDQVAGIIRRASLDLPGGRVRTEGGQVLLRTKERRYRGTEYGDISIIVDADGTRVLLRDIAEIKDSFEETDEVAVFDGKPAAMVKILRVGDQKPTEISELVRGYVEEKRTTLPTSLSIATWQDASENLKSRTDLLMKNAWLGLTLVLIILGLFLEVRLALWVMLGIPISFFGTILFMPYLGASINMISLFAFILALGILVDDAIVVGENIYDHRQKGKPYLQAAIDGAIEVAVPVTFSILTTIAAFFPLLNVSGMTGKFIYVIPVVVISLLLVSLVESLFVLPAHLALGRHRPIDGGVLGAIDANRRRFGEALSSFIEGPYRRFLDLNLRFRYCTVAVGVVALMLAFGVVKGGILKFTFMPEVDGDRITASLQMPQGTPAEVTAKVQQHIAEKALEVVAEYDAERPEGESILRNIYSLVGGGIATSGPGPPPSAFGSHVADVALLLSKSEDRGIPAVEISNRWREAIGEIPGVESLVLASNLIQIGADIDIQIAHGDFDILEQASNRISVALAEYPGVEDIQDTYSRGKKEVKIRLTPEARTLGVTEEGLGRQVRAAFYGAEALRLQRGRNEVKVMVRYPEEERKSLWNFGDMRIRTPEGGEIPIDNAAFVEEGRGFAEINRTERKRVINVTASVDSKQANAQEILGELKRGLLADLVHDYPGLTFDLEGEEKERRETMESMLQGFRLAMVVIFVLLAIPFRSYSQPLLIMAAIPFGLIGAVIGHLVMGYSLSILSIFGIVALTGVVVNDSLLLIDKVNRNRREGLDLHDSIVEGGVRRFRPILLTSLTTLFGLAPMILETSVQAKFLIPMAISLGFGILFATGITLVLIPCLYMILEDVRGLFGLNPFHANHPSK